MREENSPEKTITFSKHITQVIILKVFPHQNILPSRIQHFLAVCKCHFIYLMYLTQTYLNQHYGRKAKTTSSSLGGSFSCPGKTSHSDTSLKRMWVISLPYVTDKYLFVFNLLKSSLNLLIEKQVQGCQSYHQHEGPECSFPARENW